MKVDATDPLSMVMECQLLPARFRSFEQGITMDIIESWAVHMEEYYLPNELGI